MTPLLVNPEKAMMMSTWSYDFDTDHDHSRYLES